MRRGEQVIIEQHLDEVTARRTQDLLPVAVVAQVRFVALVTNPWIVASDLAKHRFRLRIRAIVGNEDVEALIRLLDGRAQRQPKQLGTVVRRDHDADEGSGGHLAQLPRAPLVHAQRSAFASCISSRMRRTS